MPCRERRAPGYRPGRRSGAAIRRRDADSARLPTTTCAVPPPILVSTRTPPSFRSSNQTSFGHFRRMPRAPSPPSARQTATPTARLKVESTRAASLNVQPSDRARLAPKGDIQRRPCRPRPAVCSSASAASAKPKGGPGRPSSRVLVESTSNSTSNRCNRSVASARSAARIASVSRSSRRCPSLSRKPCGEAATSIPSARRCSIPAAISDSAASSDRASQLLERGSSVASNASSGRRRSKPRGSGTAIVVARDARCRRACARCCHGG